MSGLLLQPHGFEGFVTGSIAAVASDLAVPHRDHPSHGRVGFRPAASTAHGATAQNDDVIADCPCVLGVGAQFLPNLGDFFEVLPYAGVAGIAAALTKPPDRSSGRRTAMLAG